MELRWIMAEFLTNVVTFVLFVWIMAKYAWGPLMQLLDDRKASIEAGFADIRRRQDEAERMREEYAERMRGIEAEARALIQEKVAEGRRVAGEIVDQARHDAAEAAERARRNIELEIAKARIDLRDEIASMVLSATERLLHERIDEGTDRRLVHRFLEDLDSRPSMKG